MLIFFKNKFFIYAIFGEFSSLQFKLSYFRYGGYSNQLWDLYSKGTCFEISFFPLSYCSRLGKLKETFKSSLFLFLKTQSKPQSGLTADLSTLVSF